MYENHEITDTPLDVLRNAFEALIAEPCHLALPGEALGFGLPERDIPLAELKDILMAPGTGASAKRAIWAAIVEMSREPNPSWTVAAAGLAYPGLAGFALRVCRSSPGEEHDLQAELLTEFLVALKTVDVDDPDIDDIAGWLCFRALNASWKARESQGTSGVLTDTIPDTMVPMLPVAHPDIVLSRAVRLGILSAAEADMIGRLYLEGEHSSTVRQDLARAVWSKRPGDGVSTATFYRYRNAAVARLTEAIATGELRTM